MAASMSIKHFFRRYFLLALLLGGGIFLAGCASVSENTHAYLGIPSYPPSDPARVQILQAEPKEEKVRLGEIILAVNGKPTREDIEKKIKVAAAKLGADGAFIVYDRTHIFPVIYSDYWWGTSWVSQDSTRNIVAIAFKAK
jgi:hypothetical protein